MLAPNPNANRFQSWSFESSLVARRLALPDTADAVNCAVAVAGSAESIITPTHATRIAPAALEHILFARCLARGAERMPERLSDIAIQRELGTLPGWSRRGDLITKTFQFRKFLDGIDFVAAVAKAAEAADHHPDIDIRYTKITCSLSTHSAGGITQKDLDMARQIDRVGDKKD
jgi:4a-hydroxytetrahydrobiopterin dehydratase